MLTHCNINYVSQYSGVLQFTSTYRYKNGIGNVLNYLYRLYS